MLRRVAFSVTVLLICASNVSAAIVNGDFQTGDFTGWTLFTTTNGTIGSGSLPDVVAFDTNGDSVATSSARFQVGQVVSEGLSRGGGIFQSITTYSGTLDLSVDIAAVANPFRNNLAGGVFTLLLDGGAVDSYDFGPIYTPGAIKRSTLSASESVLAGSHEIRILITRPYETEDTPLQFVDNVVASGSALVPEPSTIALWSLLSLIGGVITWRRRKRA